MIVVDSSAIIAILQVEAEAPAFARTLASAPAVAMSALNVFETVTVMRARGGQASAEDVWYFIQKNAIEIVPSIATR